jgi:hypothetical protein
MHVQHPPIRQHQQLMFSSALHPTNLRAAQRRGPARTEPAAQRGMQDAEGTDGLVKSGAAEDDRGGLDLGKLRHVSILMKVMVGVSRPRGDGRLAQQP